MNETDRSRRAPWMRARALVAAAAVLGLGTWLGLTTRSDPWSSAAVLVLAVFLGALAWRGRCAPWIALLFLCAAVRGASVALRGAAAPAPSAPEARDLRSAPIVGWWRAEPGGRTGRIEPFDAAERTASHDLLFEPEALPPEGGSAVAALPGGEVVPWARGPVPVPRAAIALAPLAPDELVRFAPPPRAPFTAWVERCAASFRELRAWLGARAGEVEREASKGLLRALATGAREGLPSARVDLFARTGTSHLLAISGWQVSLFAALLVLPLMRAPWARRARRWSLVSWLLLCAFAFLAGADKPVLRAALAVGLLVLAERRAREPLAPPRRPDGLTLLAAPFALECLLDPQGLTQLSLILTYAATLGLILASGRCPITWRAPHEPHLGVARIAPLVRRAGSFGLRTLWASAAAVLATLPFAWTTFGEFAPLGIVLTWLVSPAFTVLSVLAWLAALVPWQCFALPAELAAQLQYAILECGDALPGTPLLLPPRPLALLLIAVGLSFLGLKRGWARRMALVAFGVLALPWTAAPRGLELVALDAGHGLALVLRAPGLEALVFDAGSRDRRALASSALLPLLASWDVSASAVALSHPDRDHSSGLARLSERLQIRPWLGAPAQDRVREAHAAFDLECGTLAWQVRCPLLGLRLLRGSSEGGNEGSRSLFVRWRDEQLLLLGDAEGEGLSNLPLEEHPLRLLLAPHHGSDAPALGRLLQRTPPEEVWISSSEPPVIAAELERRHLRWSWTGRDGPLALCLP